MCANTNTELHKHPINDGPFFTAEEIVKKYNDAQGLYFYYYNVRKSFVQSGKVVGPIFVRSTDHLQCSKKKGFGRSLFYAKYT